MSEPNESWAREHARKNPGHRTTEGRQHEGGKSEAGMCETCGAKVELPDFLLARIAEDEEIARGATPVGEGRTFYTSFGDGRDDWGVWYFNVPPARVLAECEAKRRIVDLHEPTHTCADVKLTPPGFKEVGPCPTLRALALPYADHPDYRPEWRR